MKALGWVAGILVVLAGVAWGGRVYATRAMDRRALTPKTLGPATPADAAIPFTRVAVPSGSRTLIGWWVRAAPPDSGRAAPAVLFLHGNRSAISDYVSLLRFLHRQGVSTFLFDYSGFGASGGDPTLANAIQDAGTMARVFSDSAGPDARKVAMGSAAGATVLLQAIDSVQPHVSGVVLEGVDASVRGSAVRAGHVPGRLAPLLPDPANNVAAAAMVRVPALLVHSRADSRVPFADAERVLNAITARASLVKHARAGHSALLNSSRPCDWVQVLAFIHTGALPVVRVDSTNACDPARDAGVRQDSVVTPRAETTKAPQAAPAGTPPSSASRRSPPTARTP